MKHLIRWLWLSFALAANAAFAQVEGGWGIIDGGTMTGILPASNGITYLYTSGTITAHGRSGWLIWGANAPGGISDARSTTDGFTYTCGVDYTANGLKPFVQCLSSAGTAIWTYQPDLPSSDTRVRMNAMRILGADLWVVGSKTVNEGGVDRWGTVYTKLNRLTGAVIHSKEFVLGSDPNIIEEAIQISGTASANFILVSGTLGSEHYRGLLRVDPSTGALVASMFLPGGAVGNMAVDSGNQVYVADGSIHKYDGNQSPTMPELWARGAFQTFVMLSKGNVFSADIGYAGGLPGGTAIMRTTPAGDHGVFSDTYRAIIHMVADAQGRFYVNTIANRQWYVSAVSVQGQPLWSVLAETFTNGIAALNVDVRGTVYSSGYKISSFRYGRLLTFYQTPEPKPDVYVAPSGRTLSIVAPAPTVMHNDVYTDESLCKTQLASNPAHGSVVLSSPM